MMRFLVLPLCALTIAAQESRLVVTGRVVHHDRKEGLAGVQTPPLALLQDKQFGFDLDIWHVGHIRQANHDPARGIDHRVVTHS